MSQEKAVLSQEEKMMRGTAWSIGGSFISRLLGVVYIIPWYLWMGDKADEANALFNMGYNIYALFLLISTTGVNVAIAKQVAKYNALNQTQATLKLIRESIKLMLVIGGLLAGAMFILSPVIARLSGAGQELVPVLRSLSLSVLLFPAMSIIRGVFQGYNQLAPSALSQIAEQFIRVIWMLLTAFWVMKLGSGDYVQAVTQSTLAAFLGMVASIIVLLHALAKEQLLLPLIKPVKASFAIDIKGLLIETLQEAIPFVVIGSAIQIFSLIDQMTYVNVMTALTNQSHSDLLVQFSYFSANPNKIVMLLVSIAASMGGVGIALLTENYIKKDTKATASLIINNLTLLFLVILPAIVGAMLLARPVYHIFYGQSSHLAIRLFVLAMVQTLFLSLYVMLSPMLQALFENRKALRYFSYSVLVKVFLQLPAIYFLQVYGPLISTAIALALPIVLTYRHLEKTTHLEASYLSRRLQLILLMTLIMAIVVFAVTVLLRQVLPDYSRFNSLLYLLLAGGAGVLVYTYMALKTHLLDKLIGRRADQLRQVFRIRS